MFPTIKRWLLASFVFFVLHFKIRAFGLVIQDYALQQQPYSFHPSPVVSFGDITDKRAEQSNDVPYSLGSNPRFTGVLLLSLLNQQQQEQQPHETSTAFEFEINQNTEKDAASVSPIVSTSLTTSDSQIATKREDVFRTLESDKIERIVDANTILLKKKGMVRLAAVRMPSVSSGGTNSNFQFPTCFSYGPSYKVRQLLPKKTSVLVQTLGSSNNNNLPQVVLVRSDDSLVVNEELVKTGFAVVKTGFGKQEPASTSILDADSLKALQERARQNGLGIFSTCEKKETDDDFVADFEPLERSTETVYFSDGGKLRVRDEAAIAATAGAPKNPGDVRGCSDFESYEDALQWYETYQPYYGDVARLDRDGDGVPCPGLPHTTIREKYRMKVPTASVGIERKP